MALNLDLGRPLRSRQAQLGLVAAIYQSPSSEQETNWLEWKGTPDLTSRAGRATIAKAVLGFSNRDPDLAARVSEGCAYMVVGVEPEALRGVAHLDGAKLESGVGVYAGEGPDWSSDYVEFEGKSVLIVTVQAPRWGDAIHVVRKSYLPEKGDPLPEAAVFVRHTASTERATAADMDMLNERVIRQPGAYLDVSVAAASDSVAAALDISDETINTYVRSAGNALLGPYAQASETMSAMADTRFASVAVIDFRSPERLRHEVRKYMEELVASLPRLLPARAAEQGQGLVDLELINNTDVTYRSVQVKLILPPGVTVFGCEQDTRNSEPLPEPPAKFGERGSRLPGPLGTSRYKIPVLRPIWAPDVRAADDGTSVVFHSIDSRASGRSSLGPIWLIVENVAMKAVRVEWSATAHEARRRVTGSIEVPVAAAVGPGELL